MYISATGMACPVGLNAEAACAAMRAGIANFSELPYLDNRGQPIIGAMIPGLDSGRFFADRLLELLTAALQECMQKSSHLNWNEVPLLVGLPERERPCGNAAPLAAVVSRVEQALDVRFHPRFSQAFFSGHVACFEALRAARSFMKEPPISTCLVCGADSYVNASSLLWLDQHWRLKTDENCDGVIPGEAAAAVLVERAPAKRSQSGLCVAGLGFGFEKAGVLADEPLLALGLAKAARMALAEAGLGLHDIDFRLSDVSGESYGFKEQALMLGRVLRVHKEEGLELWHCAENIGDVGAAASLVHLIIALHAFAKAYAPGYRAICFASAVPGERASAVLVHPTA